MPYLFDKFFNNKTGIVNVRMVITEEKILSNIDRVQKLINPNSKKQIVQLERFSVGRNVRRKSGKVSGTDGGTAHGSDDGYSDPRGTEKRGA